MKPWRNLLLLIVCAVLAFGGTFTCKASSDDDHFTSNPKTPTK